MKILSLNEREFEELCNKMREQHMVRSEFINGRHLIFYPQNVIIICNADFQYIHAENFPNPISLAGLMRLAYEGHHESS